MSLYNTEFAAAMRLSRTSIVSTRDRAPSRSNSILPKEERTVDHKPTILVVEDDPHISTLIVILLEDAGYAVVTADTGMAGLERVNAQSLDLVVLDWILPDIQGVYLCRMIKARTSTTFLPILMLT